MRKPSFFEKLTGSIAPDDYDDLFEGGQENQRPVPQSRPSALADEDRHIPQSQPTRSITPQAPQQYGERQLNHWEEPVEEEEEGELSVDIYQTPDAIVVKALVAGVNPNNIDISLTRDMITIRGNREEHK